jgi:predicted RNase H-like HicB family nuclease
LVFGENARQPSPIQASSKKRAGNGTGQWERRLGAWDNEQHSEAGRTEEMRRYLIIVEETDTGYSAYSPDLSGCVSTGRTLEEVKQNMRKAMEFHLEGMRLEGIPVPEPHTYSDYVDVPA